MDVNTFWTDARLGSQRLATRAISLSPTALNGYEREVAIGRSDARATRRQQPLISAWSVFAMIILAAAALCFTVTKRTNAALNIAAQKYETLNTDVETLRHENVALARQLENLKSDPRAIEVAARERLNMVRANEIVIPVK